jgi:hypothetical protein
MGEGIKEYSLRNTCLEDKHFFTSESNDVTTLWRKLDPQNSLLLQLVAYLSVQNRPMEEGHESELRSRRFSEPQHFKSTMWQISKSLRWKHKLTSYVFIRNSYRQPRLNSGFPLTIPSIVHFLL